MEIEIEAWCFICEERILSREKDVMCPSCYNPTKDNVTLTITRS